MVQGHINFQERQNVLEHIKISRRALSKFCKNTYDFSGGKNAIRTDEIFQEIFVLNSLEHIRSGERNIIRIDQIFQETIRKYSYAYWKLCNLLQYCLATPNQRLFLRTDFYKIASLDAFDGFV